MGALVAAKPMNSDGTGDFGRPIDLVHLARMTLGDRSIEREVLQLFARQSATLAARIAGAEQAAIGALAHTLKGSAKGVGAWRVAAAAEAVELTASGPAPALEVATAGLSAAVEEANAIIGDLLRAH
jgi:HPt (histidine-containing phosphotransfer) domain-containing protein